MNKDKKILIIDDDFYVNEMINLYLTMNEYQTVSADNGEAALQILDNEKIDLILLDTMMPVMDGFKFLQKLAHSNENTIPIISLTAMQTKNSEQELLQAGASTVLFKPVDNNKLLEAVNHYLS